MKKVAFVHDRIFHLGGAEAVLSDLIRQRSHNQGRIFTLFADKQTLSVDRHELPITVALPRWINRLFVAWSRSRLRLINRLFDYRNLLVVFPVLVRLLRKKIERYQPEQVVISSFAAVKNIIPPYQSIQGDPHVSLYLHSPMQYIRENYDEYCRKLASRQLLIFKPVSRYLRKRDKQIRTYDQVTANSHYTAQTAQRYEISPQVVYPQINKRILESNVSTHPQRYYLYIGRLVRFVRETDLIIKLANHLHLPLVIMGDGPDKHELQQLAGDSIIFVGHISEIDQKIELIRHATALINLTKESCWIGTMEALALGVPVFGLNAGATPELVGPEMGQLVDDKERSTITRTLHSFEPSSYDREQIKKTFLAQYEQTGHL